LRPIHNVHNASSYLIHALKEQVITGLSGVVEVEVGMLPVEPHSAQEAELGVALVASHL
jgi:hypothetical protein